MKYSACVFYHLFQCCTISNLIPRVSPLHVPGKRDPGNEVVLPVAPTVRFTASAGMMWPICYSYTFFNFRPCEIQQIVCELVAYERLKTIEILNNHL